MGEPRPARRLAAARTRARRPPVGRSDRPAPEASARETRIDDMAGRRPPMRVALVGRRARGEPRLALHGIGPRAGGSRCGDRPLQLQLRRPRRSPRALPRSTRRSPACPWCSRAGARVLPTGRRAAGQPATGATSSPAGTSPPSTPSGSSATFPRSIPIGLGEGEKLIVALANGSTSGGDPRPVLPRTARATIRTNPSLGNPDDLDALPFPRRGDFTRYFDKPIASILTSRGCWRDCAFCSINAWYKQRRRARSSGSAASTTSSPR